MWVQEVSNGVAMRGSRWMQAVVTAMFGIGLSCGWAQTRIAQVSLSPYGVMTQGELNVMHPIPDPPPQYKGYMTSGPPSGIAWRGVGTLAIDGTGHVYAGLPIWATGYAPKNAARGTGDKLRVLVINTNADFKVERTMDIPTKSLARLALHLGEDGGLLIFAGDKLMRVGADGKTTAQLDVPNEEKEYEPWDLDSSTTGRTLRIRLNKQHTLVVDAKTLKVLKQCQEANEDNDTGTMTDDLQLSSEHTAKFPDRSMGLEQEAFCETMVRLGQFGYIDFAPAVVDDERFLAISDGMIALRKISGETVWTSKAPNGRVLEMYEGYELSRDGSRVGVRLLKKAQYHAPDTMNPEDIRNGTWNRTRTMTVEDSVGIWDVASGCFVGEVPLLGRTENRYFEPSAQFALSPDGHLLAVLEDGVVTAWKID
jgi:hypothetical protein